MKKSLNKEKASYNFYPFDNEDKVLEKGSLAVLRSSSLYGHLCGYCVLKKTDLPKEWHQGDYGKDGLHYLNVHGGLTYGREQGDYVVFGFDCAHLGDNEKPRLKDSEHVLKLAAEMEAQIIEHAKSITAWRASNRDTRTKMMDEIRDKAEIGGSFGFGAMLGMLGGGKEFGET